MLKSQGQIRANYQAINAVFAENHAALNSEFEGMHNLLNFRPQTIDPTTSATQIALFTKLVASNPMLFYAPSSSQTPIQLTGTSLSTGLVSTNPDVYKDEQYSFLPGPFIFYAGKRTGVTNGQIITLTPTSTLKFANVWSIYTDKVDDRSFVFALAGSTFTIGTNNAAQDIYYIAIGQP